MASNSCQMCSLVTVHIETIFVPKCSLLKLYLTEQTEHACSENKLKEGASSHDLILKNL